MEKYYLVPEHSGQKSFNNLAIVEIENGVKTLYSYNTKVAVIEKNKATVLGTHSPTTLRHIKEFLLQNNFKAVNKAQIVKDYM